MKTALIFRPSKTKPIQTQFYSYSGLLSLVYRAKQSQFDSAGVIPAKAEIQFLLWTLISRLWTQNMKRTQHFSGLLPLDSGLLCKTNRAPSKAGAIQQVSTCPVKG
jgi:hypothetical protein